MKNALLTLSGLLLFVCTSFAQIDTVSTAQIDKYIGKEVVLKGTLQSYKNHVDRNGKEIMFLDIDESFPNSKVSVTVFNSAFADINIGSEDIGKTITIAGLVKMYKDRPSIGVNDSRAVEME